MIAIDTNLLVYAHREGAPEHDRARTGILEALADPRGWGICLPTATEFWSIVTHPKIPGGPSSSAVVTHFFHYLITEGHANIWTPGPTADALGCHPESPGQENLRPSNRGHRP